MIKLKQELLRLVNERELPIEASLFVVKDLYRDIEDAYKDYINHLQEAEKNQIQVDKENLSNAKVIYEEETE